VKALSGKEFTVLPESKWMDSSTSQRQPPHLRQRWQPGSHFRSIHGSQSLKFGLQRHLMKLAGLLP